MLVPFQQPGSSGLLASRVSKARDQTRPRNQGYGSGASPLEDETARDVGTPTVQ